jgi:uncharacterized protein (TIGR02145 family)
MRKTLLFLCVIGLLMTSCEKDNDDENDQNSEDSTAVDSTDLTNSEDSSSGGGTGNIVHCLGTPTEIVDVFNPTTGKTWMDRNLGASQVATSSTDADAYGDLYQWGRGADGHQCRNSSTTSTLSSTDQPGHGDFITPINVDWRSPQNDNLWQGVNGTNNPCPSGYRLPTSSELYAEFQSWSSNDAAGAFDSPLILPMAGYRDYSLGSLDDVGSYGYYWSNTVYGTLALRLSFDGSDADLDDGRQAYGNSVRCIKRTDTLISVAL